jgi:uncharacterized membrane protein YhhN
MAGLVQTPDMAHKRPWLLLSLIFGLSYPLAKTLSLPELAIIVWKMAAIGALIPYALRRHHTGEFALLATILAFCSIGDGLIILNLIWGGIAFAIAHILAIWLYSRHRRLKPMFSQKLFAISLFILTPIIAYLLPADRNLGLQIGAYALLLGAMGAMAWSSNFPRYRVGMGAVLFIVSDLIIFAQEGPLANWAPAGLIIWYTYYFGVFSIAVGVVQTLIKRGHYSDDGLSSEETSTVASTTSVV